MKGAIYNLARLAGWYRPPTTNLTKQEADDTRKPFQGVDTPPSVPDPYGLPTDPSRRMEELAVMARSDLASPIVELYAEEASQPDVDKNKAVWVECNDSTVEKDLNLMLERVHIEDYLFSIVSGLCASGNSFNRILWSPQEGIQQLVGCTPGHVRRLWHPTNRKLLGFRWANQQPQEGHGIYGNAPDVFAPWDFIHFRRIVDTDTEYGVGLLDHLYPIWKKLSLATDQMVLYRLHTMPNRYAFNIDIGNADFTDGMAQASMWKTFLRQQVGMNSQTPGAAGGLQSRFDPAAVDSFIVMPIRGSEDKTTITTLQGDKDVPDVEDIEQLEKQFFGGARVPKGFIGREESSGLAQASLVSQDIRFARGVRVLRRPVVAGIFRLCQYHLAMKGKDPTQYRIKIKMSRISSIEEEVKAETLSKQAGLANEIAGLCQTLGIPNAQIIDLVFREYLAVPRYFLDVAKLAASVQTAISGDGAVDGGPGGGGGGGFMGGGGGLGSDLGLDEPDDDLGLDSLDMPSPTSPSTTSPTPPEPLSADSPKRNSLMEATTAKDRKRLHTAVLAISERRQSMQESVDPGKAAAASKQLEAILSELPGSSSFGPRVSLVESYQPTGSTYPLLESIKQHAAKLPAGGDFDTTVLPSTLVEHLEAAPLVSSLTEEVHPSVAAVRRARKG